MAELDDFYPFVEAVLHGFLGSVLALPLMFLHHRVDTGPTALGMDALQRQIIDNIERDQIFFQFPSSDGLFAQRTCLIDPRPILNTNIAERMSMLAHPYPHAVLTGSSKTSWQMLHFKCLLIFYGYRKSRLVLAL